MFGYVVMNRPEIKFKDYDLYRSFYCGLCRGTEGALWNLRSDHTDL